MIDSPIAPTTLPQSIRVSVVRLEDFQHAGTEPLPRFPAGREEPIGSADVLINPRATHDRRVSECEEACASD